MSKAKHKKTNKNKCNSKTVLKAVPADIQKAWTSFKTTLCHTKHEPRHIIHYRYVQKLSNDSYLRDIYSNLTNTANQKPCHYLAIVDSILNSLFISCTDAQLKDLPLWHGRARQFALPQWRITLNWFFLKSCIYS